jgi:hypothetical protein
VHEFIPVVKMSPRFFRRGNGQANFHFVGNTDEGRRSIERACVIPNGGQNHGRSNVAERENLFLVMMLNWN